MFKQPSWTASHNQSPGRNRIDTYYGYRHSTATIFTNSKITLDSLQNANNHAYLIEEIRKSVTILESSTCKIELSWVKAHVGILLTPWCRVLFEQLSGLQLVKKFPAFHGNRRLITALTSVGIYRNEMADRLAKETARSKDTNIAFNRVL